MRAYRKCCTAAEHLLRMHLLRDSLGLRGVPSRPPWNSTLRLGPDMARFTAISEACGSSLRAPRTLRVCEGTSSCWTTGTGMGKFSIYEKTTIVVIVSVEAVTALPCKNVLRFRVQPLKVEGYGTGTGICLAQNVFDCLGRIGTVCACLLRPGLVHMHEMECCSLIVPRDAVGVLKNFLHSLAFDGHVCPVCRK